MSKTVLKSGSSGQDVIELQTALTELGYPCGSIDGRFGAKTKEAVEDFQQNEQLPVDGIVDAATWAALGLGDSAEPPDDSVLDFIRWALTHVKRESIPDGSRLLIPIEECGTDPWEYLYGTSGSACTQRLLDRKYEDPYKGWDWPRDIYDRATAGWVKNEQVVCDCQGLLDAYCTQVLGIKTDLSANGCYVRWCTDAGRTRDISRAYVIGEAVFRVNDYGTMKHIGWICGFAADGEPLVIEERGLSYGCVVTRLSGRGWTHRGLMTIRFRYDAVIPHAPFYAVCSGGSVNIRSGAGTVFEKLAVAHRGDLILSLPAVDGWCCVAVALDDDIVRGFMSEKYVSREV